MDLTFQLDRFIGMLGDTLTTAVESFGKDRPTLRDQFAMAALTGLLAADAGERNVGLQGYARHDYELTAETAYDLADAMLAAREPKTEQPK